MVKYLEKVVSFDKTSISYLIKKGKKDCVVMLHGMAGGYQCWAPIYNYLNKKGYTVISLDLRSHGKSGRPIRQENCDISSIIKDINCILKKEKIKKVTILAHSYSTFVAIAYYAKYTPQISSLILLSGHHRPKTDKKFSIGFKTFLLFPKVLSLFFRKDIFVAIDFSKYKGRTDYDIPKIFKEIISVNPVRYLKFMSELKTFNAKDYISEIKIPLLLIHGTKDICINKNIPYEYNAQNPNSRLLYYKGVNHHIPVNLPDYLKKHVYEFIESPTQFDKKMRKHSIHNEEKVFLIEPILA